MYACMYSIRIYHPYIEARECYIYSRFSVSSLICPLHTGITHVIKVLEPCSSHAVKPHCLDNSFPAGLYTYIYVCTVYMYNAIK